MKRICIVEDENNIADMYKALFEAEGCEVRCVALGAREYFVKSHITPRHLLDKLYRLTAFAS